MKFNPEDSTNTGPHCRNCHKGSSDCGICHDQTGSGVANDWPKKAYAAPTAAFVDDNQSKVLKSTEDTVGLQPAQTSYATGGPTRTLTGGEDFWKHERTVYWNPGWRTMSTIVSPTCSNDGFSWPHKTMGFKMLKDEMWGLDFDGTVVNVGQVRDGVPDYISADGNMYAVNTATLPQTNLVLQAAHDLDSACLDCHPVDTWSGSIDYVDTQADPNDDKDDELLFRGLP